MSYNRIVLVANTAWAMFNFRYGLIIRLIDDGFDVIIIAPHDDFSERLRGLGCTVIDLHMSAKGANPIEDIFLIGHLYKQYRFLKPDFIIHYTIKPNIYGSIAAKLAGIKSLAITTGLGYTFLNENLVARVARLLYKFAFLFPQEVWFLNRDDMQTFLQNKLVTPIKAKLLHGEGVNLNYFTPLPYCRDETSVRFLLIARMLWDKGIAEYVKAARLIHKVYPNAVFQLLGHCGVANPSAIGKSQIKEWQLEGVIEYLGTTDDVRPVIARAHCVVLPSYREGIPRTMIESAAMAKPLIVSDAPGCRDVVLPDITGFICPVKNATALAECFEKFILMTTDQKREMGNAGRTFMINNFDEKIVINQYVNFLAKYEVYGSQK